VTSCPTTENIENPKLWTTLPKSLQPSEVEALLKAPDRSTPDGLRDAAMLELLYATGLRVSELIHVKIEDLVMDAGFLRTFGKGSKERIVPFGSSAAEALEEWFSPRGRARLVPAQWRRRDDAEAVFLNTRGGRLSRQAAWLVVKKYGERAGITEHLSPHVLRHSCATHLLDHGADLRVVQELLGHSSVATTAIYTHLDRGYLREVHRTFHPRP